MGLQSVGQFGVPLQTNMHAQAAGTFAHLRLSLGQQRKSRALQMERLEISPRSSTALAKERGLRVLGWCAALVSPRTSLECPALSFTLGQ